MPATPTACPPAWPSQLSGRWPRPGNTTLEQLTQVTEADLAQLHGIGATAIGQLRRALAAAGLSFAPEN